MYYCVYTYIYNFYFTIPWYLEKTACTLPSPFVLLTMVMASTGTYWNPGMLSSAHHLPAVFPPWFFHWKYSDCLANGLRTSKHQHGTWIIRWSQATMKSIGGCQPHVLEEVWSWWKENPHCIRFSSPFLWPAALHPKKTLGDFWASHSKVAVLNQESTGFGFHPNPMIQWPLQLCGTSW